MSIISFINRNYIKSKNIMNSKLLPQDITFASLFCLHVNTWKFIFSHIAFWWNYILSIFSIVFKNCLYLHIEIPYIFFENSVQITFLKLIKFHLFSISLVTSELCTNQKYVLVKEYTDIKIFLYLKMSYISLTSYTSFININITRKLCFINYHIYL